MWKLLAVSAVVMGLSQTLAKERIFEAFRAKCGGKETFLGYLVSCPYCASHYFAFLLVPLTGAYYVPVTVQWGWFSTVLTWFFSSILVTVIAAFLRVGFWFVDQSQGLVRRQQAVVEEEAKTEKVTRKKVEKELEAEDARLHS